MISLLEIFKLHAPPRQETVVRGNDIQGILLLGIITFAKPKNKKYQ